MIPNSASVFTLIETIAKQLAARYNDYTLCHQYAWWMVQAVKNESQASLIGHQAIHLTSEQQQQLQLWIDKQVTEAVPLQYLLGSVPFNSVEIFVEPPTLIPRPETEEWVASLTDMLQKNSIAKLNILDLCTGSGCIALSLAKSFSNASCIGIDISEKAIALSKKNALHNNVRNISFIQSDLYEQVPLYDFDIIVSNPPYIDEQEWLYLDDSVRKWEDKRALIAPDQGLAIIKKIIMQAPERLRCNELLESYSIPQLLIEIDHTQGAAVQKLMQEAGFEKTTIMKDLEGKDRVVTGAILKK